MNTQYLFTLLLLLLRRSGVIGMVLVLISGSAHASAEGRSARLSQSVVVSSTTSAQEQQRRLDIAPVRQDPGLLRFGSRPENRASRDTVSAHPSGGHLYRIFDAQSVLLWDYDDDGFYHKFRVSFDADVDYGEAHVYAKLYLSYEGGPWNHYFTTDVFHILDSVAYDDYVVVTRLLEGYPSGYYDVLIELYDADSGNQVTSFGPYDDWALSALPLEDDARDYNYPSSISYGGGSLDWLFALVLVFSGVVVAVNRKGLRRAR